MSGLQLGVATAHDCAKFITFNYTSTVVTGQIFTTPFKCQVSDILGNTTVAGTDGSAVTFAFYKSPSGTAVGSGTILHSGTFNVKGTANTNQTLTLVPNVTTLTLNKGDSIGVVLTGTATTAQGCITIALEPIR